MKQIVLCMFLAAAIFSSCQDGRATESPLDTVAIDKIVKEFDRDSFPNSLRFKGKGRDLELKLNGHEYASKSMDSLFSLIKAGRTALGDSTFVFVLDDSLPSTEINKIQDRLKGMSLYNYQIVWKAGAGDPTEQ